MSRAVPPAWPEGWSVGVAGTHRTRRRGLLGRDRLDTREGLWLPVRSVHTIGMAFALDLVWLDRLDVIVRLDEHVGPGRVRTCIRARSVVEVPAGSGLALANALGGDADAVRRPALRAGWAPGSAR